MAAASRDQYCQWVVDALKDLGTATPKHVYAWIKANRPVPAADLNGSTPDGEPLFEKEIRFARWALRRSGVIDGSRRGVWALT